MYKKRIIQTLWLAISVALCSLTACSAEEETVSTQSQTSKSRSSIVMSLNEDDTLQIARPSRNEKIPMGEDGTWTIFVYLCGTDLESDNGMATMDMEEMQSASTDDTVQFVVQTGGTYK